jgi:hypothetical protein
MVDIAVQSPSWSGTPRRNQNQYIQSTINANSAGTTYNLLSGTHRGQSFAPKDGDTIIFNSGAKLVGAEDVSGGWSDAGSGRYSKAITRSETSDFGNSNCRTGYECGELSMLLVDGRLLAWVTDINAVDEYSAYYSGGTAYIYGNPSGKLVEICRQARAIWGEVDNVTIKADNSAEGGGSAPAPFLAEIYGYACDAQSTRAGVAPTREYNWPGDSYGTGWLMQDLWIHGMAGYGYAEGDSSTSRRVHITDCGQMGHGGSSTGSIMEYCRLQDNGVGGWRAGWEGGNNKWAHNFNHINRSNLFAATNNNPNVEMTSVCWYDISNDGAEIYDNILYDANEITWRGLFWEISESAKMWRNICWGLCRDSENAGWAKGMFSSESGPVVGSRWSTIEMYENHFYRCGGGPGGVENGPREYEVHDLDIHHNIVYYSADTTYDEETGVVDWNSSFTPYNCDFDYNVYFGVAGTNTWRNSVVGGSGYGLTWAEWQSDGQDVNGEFITERSHPSGDPNPFNGGCLAGGF